MKKDIKQLIQLMFKKYNKTECTFVKEVDPVTMGVMCSCENSVKFDLIGGKLFVEATITKDNIHLYYEFMSEEDLIKHKVIISDVFDSRKNLLPPFFKNIYLKGKGVWHGIEGFIDSKQEIVNLPMTYGNYTLKQSIFGVEDTLKPIEEYIEGIKSSEEYMNFLWEKLGDIPTNEDDEIDEDFMDFKKGTHREEIWFWFEETYNVSVTQMMNI